MRGGEFISLPCFSIIFSYALGVGKEKVPSPSPGNFTASALSAYFSSVQCSIPPEKNGDNTGLSGRGGGGETGCL